jgi:acyl-CoA thioester hydrolase
MPRIKIDLPAQFHFSTEIPIRITVINYGGHVGNDTILSLIHEARVQYLQHYGYRELEIGGVGLIMSDASIDFKKELFYGNRVKASVAAGTFTKATFDLFYKMEIETEGRLYLIATAKTGMVCYDYNNKKIVAIPEDVKQKIANSQH